MLQDDKACRFNYPGSTTLETLTYRMQDDQLQDRDPGAWELTHALIQDAHDYGLSEEENAELVESCPDCFYRAPIGKRAFKKAALNPPVPWTGELRVEETGAGDDRGGWWRTYFHDLLIKESLADEVLLSSVCLKTAGKAGVVVGRFKMNQQDKDIVAAMHSARKWVARHNSYQIRPLRA